jgi:CPA2 family monovalent cation:H+ antiporter-2
MGFKVFYGDATRVDLLESAGAEGARIFVSAIDDAATNEALVETLKKHFPHLKLMMRTRHRYDAYELIEHGVKDVYRDHIDTSVRLGVDVLRTLGMRGYSAVRAGQNFLKFDEAALVKLAKQRHDMKQYIASVREEIEHQEELLKNDFNFSPNDNDHAWDSEHMRETIQRS